MSVLLDDRSARSVRNTGWERYARSLLAELAGHVVGAGISAGTLPRRLATDWVSMPALARRYAAVHYPTFPPTMPSRSRCVYTVHDLTWWKFPETASPMGRHYYRPLAERALKRCHIIAVSSTVRDELIADMGVAPDRVTATPLGVVPLPVPAAPEVRARPYLLTVGTLEPRKNLERLVRGYRNSGLAADYEMVVVGRLGWGSVPAGVTWLGAVSDERLVALYAGARAFFSASRYEGFGLPVLEAMAAGTPVYCSDIPVFREVGGGHVEYFHPLDVDDISAAIVRSFGAAPVDVPARSAWLEQFTWQRTAERTLAAYTAAGALVC